MIYELSVIGVAIADRFLLKRNRVEIESVKRLMDKDVIRFAIDFKAKGAFKSGVITYSLRNKKHPTAVISNSRTLAFSKSGLNSEFLTFDAKELQKEAGEPIHDQSWILHVQIERSCSRVNPLYKIFPTTTCYSEEFYIE